MAWLQAREREAFAFLEALVNQDSGTHDRADANRVGDLLAKAYEGLGLSVERIPQSVYGDHLVASHQATRGSKRLLCVGHMDTVYPAGSARSRPFCIEGSRATGPGVLDMKGGLTVLLFALRALVDTNSPAFRGTHVTVLVNSDEEVGSPSSRPIINDLDRGTTVNVGVIRGGERSNVVPDYACADVDLRIWSLEEGDRITRALQEIARRSTISGATGKLSGEISTPPWQAGEGTRRMLALFIETWYEYFLPPSATERSDLA